MATLQMTGLASGLDTRTMVNKLMELERRPIYLKQQEIQKVEFEKKHWNDIGKQVKTFKSTVQDMSRDNVFRRKKSEISDEKILGVELGPSAKKGTYIIENIKLAKPGQATSNAEVPLEKEIKTNITSGKLGIRHVNTKFIDMFLSPFGNMEFGDIGFKINKQEINIEASDTLGTFINKINASGAGVRASFDNETRRFKIESESAKTIQISAEKASFLRGLEIDQYNGKKVENYVEPEYKQVMSNVDNLKNIKRGFFTINDFTVEVNPDFDSVDSIVQKLNGEGSPVKAYYDESTNKLNLVAREAGDDILIQDDTSDFLDVMGLLKKNPIGRREKVTIYEGEKATFTIDGIKYERDSNDIIFNGIKINMLATTEGNEKVTINIDNDYEAMVGKIDEFVKGYNDTIALINTKTVKDGPLQGNTTANTLSSTLRRHIGNSVNGVESKYSQLALIGIATMGKEPNLNVNYNKLKAALEDNPIEIEKLFTQMGQTSGSEVVATGNGERNKFYTLNYNGVNPKDIQVRVGNKVYSTDGKYKLMKKSELQKLKVSKTDMIKYVMNGDIKSKADLDARLGKGVPSNAVVIDDVTGALEFGNPPGNGENIVIESSKNVNQSRYGNAEGIATKLSNYLSPFVDYGGTFDRQSKAFDSRIDQMNDWIARTDDRLKMREDALKRQFASMEGSMQYSNSQSSWLAGQIAQL